MAWGAAYEGGAHRTRLLLEPITSKLVKKRERRAVKGKDLQRKSRLRGVKKSRLKGMELNLFRPGFLGPWNVKGRGLMKGSEEEEIKIRSYSP